MPRKASGALEKILPFWKEGKTMRVIAEATGFSRSLVQRVIADHVRSMHNAIDPVRGRAGNEALPVGHPLSWGSISATPYEPRA